MRDREFPEDWGGYSLRDIVEAMPSCAPPHLSEDALWAIAASESALPVAERQEMFKHVCACRDCFRVLMGFRGEQLNETNAPAGLGLDVWERWASLRVSLLVSLSAIGLKLKARPFPMRMRDGAVAEPTEIVLKPTQAFEIDFDRFKLALRLINFDAVKNTLSLTVEIAAHPSEVHLNDLVLQVRRDGREVILSMQCGSGEIELGELPVSAYTILLIKSDGHQLIGAIEFTPSH